MANNNVIIINMYLLYFNTINMSRQKQAFTLVELIVVITILAILWTIAFISLQWYSKDARDSIRISDISNIKTSLELFHLNSWKYPLPDDKQIVDYGTEILWYQWDFWSSVISSLSRSISEVPTDPLTDKKYIFSVANNKNEFEILSLLEWDSVALNSISQTNAASLVVTPKIDGTYNRVFIKTANYIVPVPSIINTEVWDVTMTLDSNNISSQVINWGDNIPEQWNIVSNTWALTWLKLSAYTWSITINDNYIIKEAAIEKIKEAYSGSVLASSDIYNYILTTTWTEWLVKLANSIILNDDTTEVIIAYNAYSTCTWVNTPTPFSSSTIYWEWTWNECDTEDIIVCDWVWSWYTIAACNVWTNTAATAYNDTGWYWKFFQWWNNFWFSSPPWSASTWLLSIISTWSTYSGNTFIYNTIDWNSPQNDNLWWNATNTDLSRIWPCATWYHVPSQTELLWMYTAWWWTNWPNMYNDLLWPMPGFLDRIDYTLYSPGLRGIYWSSSPDGASVHVIDMWNSSLTVNINHRAYGFPVRCFKN